ncbi:hypothetical protein ACJ5H2_02620 [Nocardioides sp. R1-1]|uniref:WXG100-like domain-containing protein n=1 Tax=Nocardioides sp. R1-1 TaxID=3383502 RepID=UPI0038D1B55C
MAVMLPDNLIWILDKLGLEWPDINEDEVHKAADLTRTFRDDLEALIQQMDTKIVTDLAAGVRSRSGEAYLAAWNVNRSQNMQKLLDSLDPIAMGIDGAGYVVTGLKVKFLAQLAFTLATLVPLLALGPLGAAAAAARMIATKVATGILVDLAVSGVIEAVDGPVIEMLKDVIPGAMQMILDAPIVEDTGADLGEIYFDFQVMEQAEADMNQHAGDAESIITQFMTDIADLHITE